MPEQYVIESEHPESNRTIYCDADTGKTYRGMCLSDSVSPVPDTESHGPFERLVSIGFIHKASTSVISSPKYIRQSMDDLKLNDTQRGNVQDAITRSFCPSIPPARQLADFEQAAWDGNLPELERLSQIVGINALLDSERIQKEIGHPDTALTVVLTADYDTKQILPQFRKASQYLKDNGALTQAQLSALSPTVAPGPRP